MSSPKTAAKAAQRSKRAAKPPTKPAVKVASKPAAKPANSNASTEAKRLAADIERALAKGETDIISAEALQALMGALCKSYAAEVEGGKPILPLGQRTAVSPTEVMVTASGLLKAANLAVFELGMWQSWTGR
jgi:hypothetical protein